MFASTLRNRKNVAITAYTIHPVRFGGGGGGVYRGCGWLPIYGGAASMRLTLHDEPNRRKSKSALFFTWSPPRFGVRYRAMLLVIDNYDSFTYNLVQYLGELGVEMKISRNNEITLE